MGSGRRKLADFAVLSGDPRGMASAKLFDLKVQADDPGRGIRSSRIGWWTKACYERAACDVDGQFSNTLLGKPAVCYSRQLTEQLAAGPDEFRRGLAQRSSRLGLV
jgi:hypothetical protein